MSRVTFSRRRVFTALGLAGVLATGTAITVAVNGPESSQAATTSAATAASDVSATRAISCDTKKGGKPFYDGPSASKKYDGRFSNSAALPRLGSYIPQGIGTWWNWSGSKNLLLVAMYHTGKNSIIVGIDPATNKVVGDVAIARPTPAGSPPQRLGVRPGQHQRHPQVQAVRHWPPR